MNWDEMVGEAPPQVSREHALALDTLAAACETDAPASLLAAHMTLSSSGRLVRATEAGVVVDLSRPPPDPLCDGAACAVTFPLAGRSAGFTAHVTHVEDGPRGGLRVTLSVPARVRMGEQRASVRVPVLDGLGAALLKGESVQQVQVIDISLHGVLIEFRDDAVPDIAEGHRRMLVLKLEERKVLLEAEVRRRDGPRYGLRFMFRDRPPRELIRIVGDLAQRWYASAETAPDED